MFIPIGALIVIVLIAFMLGMLTAFIMVINAMMRFRK